MSTLSSRAGVRDLLAFPADVITGFFDSAEFILSQRHGSNGLRAE